LDHHRSHDRCGRVHGIVDEEEEFPMRLLGRRLRPACHSFTPTRLAHGILLSTWNALQCALVTPHSSVVCLTSLMFVPLPSAA
jgi:hypothetical protein